MARILFLICLVVTVAAHDKTSNPQAFPPTSVPAASARLGLAEALLSTVTSIPWTLHNWYVLRTFLAQVATAIDKFVALETRRWVEVAQAIHYLQELEAVSLSGQNEEVVSRQQFKTWVASDPERNAQERKPSASSISPCPYALHVFSNESLQSFRMGLFLQTTRNDGRKLFNGRAMYKNAEGHYLYYHDSSRRWVVGFRYSDDSHMSGVQSGIDSQAMCPQQAKDWEAFYEEGWFRGVSVIESELLQLVQRIMLGEQGAVHAFLELTQRMDFNAALATLLSQLKPQLEAVVARYKPSNHDLVSSSRGGGAASWGQLAKLHASGMSNRHLECMMHFRSNQDFTDCMTAEDRKSLATMQNEEEEEEEYEDRKIVMFQIR